MATKTRTSKPKLVERKHPKIVSVLRVKNEEPYIERAIRSLLPLRGEIIVLDDGSTDDTPRIVKRFDAVHYHRQDDLPMDEGRDRTFLYREALKLKPEWVLTIDGDEELAESSPERILAACEKAPEDVNAFGIIIAIMWGEDQCFAGREIWEMDRMFRVRDADPEHEFKGFGPGNLHCRFTPKIRDYKRQLLNAWIKYWGYETVEKSERKVEFYKEHDEIHYESTRQKVMGRIEKRALMTFHEDMDARAYGIQDTHIYV